MVYNQYYLNLFNNMSLKKNRYEREGFIDNYKIKNED